MGSVQDQGAREKERESQSVAVGSLVGRDKLRPTHLRATLTRLLDHEREEWQPSSITHPTSQGDDGEVGCRDVEVWWQWDACEGLGWAQETRFTAVVLLDRLLHRVKVPSRYLHAVAAAAVFLAAKIHEEDENVPATMEVVERGGMRCSWRELLRMERVCLDKLAWRLPATSMLDLLQVLHALAITSAPRHAHLTRNGSPTRQLAQLTSQLWCVVASGRSGQMRPSLLSLALLSLELDQAATPEPGLVLWLQALTQVNDEELAEGRALVQELLEAATFQTTPLLSPPPLAPPHLTPAHLTPSSPTRSCPPSRPNKRKVAQSLESEEDMYLDIKRLYAYEKGTTGTATTSSICKQQVCQDELDETYSDIRHLYTSPTPQPATTPQPDAKLQPQPPTAPKKPSTTSKKRKRKKTKPTFKAKNMKSCLKQALKIPCKISLITTKKIFEEVEEEEDEEVELEVEEEGVEVEAGEMEDEGLLVEPVGLLKSPVFFPMSPEFPDIKNLVVKKEDMCWHQRAQEVAEQVYRPLTYAQVLRLHLTPLTRALGV